MSKKKKFKKFFRRQLASKAEILAELERAGTRSSSASTINHQRAVQVTRPPESPGATAQTPLVKKDLLKIIFLFGGLTIFLLIIYFISLKSTLVTQLADFLFRLFHLS